MMVLFDLPVGTKNERKKATRFRTDLLDAGFAMAQFSVYLKVCVGKEQAESLTRHVEKRLPSRGSVHILLFTDKQYENMVTFTGAARDPIQKNPSQYVLF